MAECVRAGIQGISKGQKEAAASVGLNPNQILKLVIMPQALRIIIPPTTNQYLNLTKNSSLAAAIAYPDLVLVFAGTALMQTGKAIEIVGITMLTYLTISLSIAALRALPLPEKAEPWLGVTYMTIKGYYIPSMIWENLNVFLSCLLASIISIIFIKIYAKKIQEKEGKQLPVLYISLGLITILPLLSFLFGGVTLDFELPVLKQLAKTSFIFCLLYTSPSPRDLSTSRMPSSA